MSIASSTFSWIIDSRSLVSSQMPQVVFADPNFCRAGSPSDQKVQLLLNQDMNTLTTFFDEKCNKISDMYTSCPAISIQAAEAKICELRRLKAQLFPNVSAQQGVLVVVGWRGEGANLT